jgi:phosphatidylglycerol:prolipoprotein diacylglycerol transferase
MAVALAIVARRTGTPFLHLGDLATLGGAFGFCLGRIGNFMNGELYGRITTSAVPWAMKFPREMFGWISESPEKLLALAPVAGKFGSSSEQWQSLISSLPSSSSAVAQGLDRLLFLLQHGDSEILATLAPILSLRHPSQIYESILEGGMLFVALLWFWRVPRKPGVISSVFLIGYALTRFVCEEFREPDINLGYELFGLTRGQWLSVATLLAGIVYNILARRRDAALI